VKLGRAVAGHRQLRIGMSCQLHGLLERGAALVKECDIGMSQGVEVGVQRAVRPIDNVGDAGGFQVRLEHVGGSFAPRARLDRLIGRLASEVVSQGSNQISGKGLDGLPPVLGITGLHGRGWRGGVEVE
jgi:hypothetical protein